MAMETHPEGTRNDGMDFIGGAWMRGGSSGDVATIPSPGSEAAVARGCACPVIDNGRGQGAYGGVLLDGEPIYWITEGCPLHDPVSPQRFDALWEWLMFGVFGVAAWIFAFYLLPAWTG